MVAHAFNPSQMEVRLRPVWSTKQVPGQPELERDFGGLEQETDRAKSIYNSGIENTISMIRV